MQPKLIERESTAAPMPALHLCDSCVHCDDCHLQEMPTKPVFECEEYFDGTIETEPQPSTLAAVSTGPSASETPLVGLCVNCDHRDNCKLPRPVGGVWHCEEYQ